MICIYEADCTDFSNNGLGVLLPQSCSVTETLNGEYELTLTHPLDDAGRWTRLIEGRILRAPVPAAMTPQMKLVNLSTGVLIYRVSTSGGRINLRSGPDGSTRSLNQYRNKTEVIVLNKTTNDFYEVTAPDGKRGYMASQYLTYVRTEDSTNGATNQIVEQTQQRDQPFRIYRVVPDLEKITVYARHIFYDLMENMVQKYEPTNADSGALVVQTLKEKCLSAHGFSFYSDLETTADNFVLENINPVEAILGEEGIAEKYKGELARDWYDVYLVQRVGSDTDVQIRQGKNLTGISYDVDVSSVTTRIMPTGQDKDGNVLYLPELYLDSPMIDTYPAPKWIHLDVSEAKEVTSGDDKKTKEKCYEEMRKAAQDEFDKGCDLPSITLKVDFVSCEDTVEYAQYAHLRCIYIGDAVQVIAPRIGISVSMRMTQYTYDCLTKKYTSMTLGTVAETIEGTTISARQIASASISSTKLINSSIGSLNLQANSIQSKHIAAEAITADKFAAGAVDAASIDAITAKIASLTAEDIKTDELAAALAAFTVLTCGTATFDRATVTHLVAQALNLSFGVGDEVFINNLKVAYAQVVSATIGQLCIKASDGSYYAIDVDADGKVSATLTTVSDGEITTGQTSAGRFILETSITAEQLNTSNLLASYALVNRIDAARIDVDTLFARDAFISRLTTSEIIGGRSLSAIAEDADAVGAEFRRVLHINDSGLHIGDTLTNSEVLIDSTSVCIVLNGVRYSTFGSNYVQFGSYQLRKSADGGLVFKKRR